MKIDTIIRQKRKELGLTQEQVGALLGVSAPAVNKWEKGAAYPDITLLPALARLLKTDLNTLLSFQEDLTDWEIESFVNGLSEIAQTRGYDRAFQMGIEKIHAYPNCESLIYSVIFYLEGEMHLLSVPEPGRYQGVFESYYQNLTESQSPAVRDAALSMCIAYARKRGDFEKAEALIQKLPWTPADREGQLGVLYQQQKKYTDAQKIWERKVWQGATEVQRGLMGLLEIALAEDRWEDATYFGRLYDAVTKDCGFPDWMGCNGLLEVAFSQKDPEQTLNILGEMLPSMKKSWSFPNSGLYRHLEGDELNILASRVADSMVEEMKTREEYAFLRETPAFWHLIGELEE